MTEDISIENPAKKQRVFEVNEVLIDRLCSPITKEEYEIYLKKKPSTSADNHYCYTKYKSKVDYEKLRNILRNIHNPDMEVIEEVADNVYMICSVIEMLISYEDYDTISNILNMDLSYDYTRENDDDHDTEKIDVRGYIYEFIFHKLRPEYNMEGKDTDLQDVPEYDRDKIPNYEELMRRIISVESFDEHFYGYLDPDPDSDIDLEHNIFAFGSNFRIEDLFLTLYLRDLYLLLIQSDSYCFDEDNSFNTLRFLSFDKKDFIKIVKDLM